MTVLERTLDLVIKNKTFFRFEGTNYFRHITPPISCVLNKIQILSYLAFLSVFVGKFSDGLLAKELLDNMSQEAAEGDAPGRLSPLKQADAEVQKICDQVSLN